MSLIQPLKHIVNLVFSTGIYPDVFKKSVIVPIYKGGDRHDRHNYRSIALTSCVSKLVEKCIKLRLGDFLRRNDLLSDLQFGFREGRSTEDAIGKITDFRL